MLFIIDGDAKLPAPVVRPLLEDIIQPYDSVNFLSSYAVEESIVAALEYICTWYEDTTHDRQHDISDDLENCIYIVAGAETRPEEVNYCIDNNIQVLDLEKGLYPVTEKIKEDE